MTSDEQRNQPSTVGPEADPLNRRILEELQADGRLPLAELGRRIGLSPPAVSERLQRLHETGAITGFHAQVAPGAAGLPLGAVIRIRPAAGQVRKVAQVARDAVEIVECHRITGEDCFIAKAHVRDVHHLEELIDRFVLYGSTTTSVIQSSPVPARGLPLA